MLKLAASPVPFDHEERSLHELSHSRECKILGRSLWLGQRVQGKNGFGVWRQLVVEKRPMNSGSTIRDVGSRGNTKWGYRRHWRDQQLDDDVKVSEVVREAPPTHGDTLLVNSQQFEGNCQLQPVGARHRILNSNEKCTMEDNTNEAENELPDSGTSAMDVDLIFREGKSESKEGNFDKQATGKAWATSGKESHSARDCWSRDRSHRGRILNDVEKQDTDQSGEIVFVGGNSINDVTVSHSGLRSARRWMGDV